MTIFFYETNSNAAPFVSESGNGFIKAETPMKALKKTVKEYKHPCGLYAATISECSPKRKTLARYLSGRANTLDGVSGKVLCEGKEIYVNDKKVKIKMEKFENL